MTRDKTRPWRAALRLAACLLCAPMFGSALAAEPPPGFYRTPALRGNQLWFTAEGDIWRVGAAGGKAERITTHAGQETWPAVSPDARWLAFVASYEGPSDAYVMPVEGGTPKRLSWIGQGVRVLGFSPQGEVLLVIPSIRGTSVFQLMAVNPVTQVSRLLPVAQGSDGAVSADGQRLYFTRNGLRGDNARQYRGGARAHVWSLDLNGTAEATPLLADTANNRLPMPYRDAGGERIAFLSDRDGTVNLWSMNPQGSDLRQHTRHKGWDIRSASIDGNRVAYALGADLHVLDLADNADNTLPIALGGDFDQQRQRWVQKPQDFLTDIALAPNGERVALTVRGHLATQGPGPLRRAELPMPPDGRCHEARFSHDNRHVLAMCDFSGEREIWRFPANGVGEAQQLTHGAQAMRLALHPSPDGRYVAHTDKEGRLSLTDLKAPAATATRVIDQAPRGNYDNLTWSPDGRALAYARASDTAQRPQLMLYTLADNQAHVLSSDRYVSGSPAFTPDGKWMYFLSDRQFNVSGRGSPWGDRNMGPFFDKRTRIYALALQTGLRFPFAPADELNAVPPAAAASAAPATPVPAPTSAAAPASVPASGAATSAVALGGESVPKAAPVPKLPAIAVAGLAQRLYELPLPAGNYDELRTDGKRLWYQDGEAGGERGNTLRSIAIDNLGGNPELLSTEVRQFELSADGKKMMLVRGASGAPREILLLDTAAKLPAELARLQVRWSDWRVAVDPKAEWRQMFADAWRMHRDYFYDKDMHGVDWPAVRRKYEPLVARVTERSELGEVLAQMVSEVSALHSQIVQPDLRSGPEDIALGMLGARFEKTADGFRIAQIYRGDPELPSELGPLAAPNLGLAAGDVITAVNGREAKGVADLSDLLRGQVGRQVLLSLHRAKGSNTAARSWQAVVTPVTVRRDRQLQLRDWTYSRAEQVLKASQGRIGYLHLAAMGRDDIANFAREFYTHVGREGLIIDVRFNGGGSIDSWVLEKLLRRTWMQWQRRSPAGTPPVSNMQQTFNGHLAVLINEETYSDGETFAAGFKALGLGQLVGKRTSGAGVWLSDGNQLLDNGRARAAESGQFMADGQWIIEGKGVSPDIEVDNPPRATFMGQDAQLEAAIAQLQKRMAEQPVTVPKPGPYLRPITP